MLKLNPEILVSKEEKFSFWNNVYNFLSIDLIIKEEQNIKKIDGYLDYNWNLNKKHD